jgi:hypothetical protein
VCRGPAVRSDAQQGAQTAVLLHCVADALAAGMYTGNVVAAQHRLSIARSLSIMRLELV